VVFAFRWFALSASLKVGHHALTYALGFTTITSTAILFGKTALNMRPSALILVGVITTTSGICGSLFWPFIQRRYGWTNHKVLIMLVIMCSMIPAYGCLGFLTVLRRAKFGGLTTQGEMFGLAVYFGPSPWRLVPSRTDLYEGTVYGAFQSYARAFYAELLPPGEEARWCVYYNAHRPIRLIISVPCP
jgi:UMF1 family MFS transporter